MELFRLFGSILVDNDEANRSIQNTTNRAERSGLSFKKLGAFAIGAGTAIASGIAVGSVAILALTNKLTETSAEILKFSQITGHTTDEYQRWDNVMKMMGFSMEQANGDLAALGEKAMDAAMGAGEGAELFGMLGVEVTDAGGKLLSQQEIFARTIAALQEMENVTERNAIASALMSTTGEELVPVLNMTAKELDNLKSKTNIISEEDLQKSEDYRLKVDELRKKFESLGMQLAVQFLPISEKLLSWFEKAMPFIEISAQKTFDTIASAINTALPVIDKIVMFIKENVMPAFDELKNNVDSNMPAIQKTIQEVVAFITDNILPPLIEWFSFLYKELLPELVTMWQEWFPKIAETIQATWNLIKPILELLKQTFDFVFPYIKIVVINAIKIISGVVSGLIQTLTGVIQFITALFTNDWELAWTGIKNIFIGIFQAIKSNFQTNIDWIYEKVKWILEKVEQAKRAAAAIANVSGRIGSSVVSSVRSFIQGRAEGGSVNADESYIVGEKGPELFMSNKSGTIIPNHKLSSNKPNFNLTINNPLLLNQDGVDIIMDEIIGRLRTLGVDA